jgi:hypothetical protein
MLDVIIIEHVRFLVLHLDNDLGLDNQAVYEATGRREAALAMVRPE